MVRHVRNAAALTLLLFLPACEEERYEIEMRTEGPVLHRKITCWAEKTEDGKRRTVVLSKEKRAPVAKAYAHKPTLRPGDKLTFEGAFTGAAPQDLGGAGSLTHLKTDMGSLSAYMERFRGDIDLASNVEKRLKACDRVTGLLTGWFEAELGKDPSFPKLKAFLDGPFRKDLKNVGLRAWLGDVLQVYEGPGRFEMAVSLAQYLVERGYFEPRDAPQFARAATELGDGPDEAKRFMALVRRIVAKRMGLDPDKPHDALKFLASPETAEKSLSTYLSTTKEYALLVKQWREAREKEAQSKKGARSKSEKPKPTDVLTDPLATALALELALFGGDDKVTVRLATGAKPIETNGAWDSRTKTVTWKDRPLRKDRYPTLCYAIWSVPDAAFQKQHLGKLILAGEDLAGYAMWRKALSKKESDEWDRFLAGLRPGRDLQARIQSFRFPWEPKPKKGEKDAPKGLADTPREILLKALKK